MVHCIPMLLPVRSRVEDGPGQASEVVEWGFREKESVRGQKDQNPTLP